VVQRSTELTSPRAGQYIADSIPRAELDTFPNSSHCPFWEEAGASTAPSRNSRMSSASSPRSRNGRTNPSAVKEAWPQVFDRLNQLLRHHGLTGIG
jgi:hypothetical protein